MSCQVKTNSTPLVCCKRTLDEAKSKYSWSLLVQSKMDLTSFSSLKYAHLPSMIIMQCSSNGEFLALQWNKKKSRNSAADYTKKTPINKFKEFLNFFGNIQHLLVVLRQYFCPIFLIKKVSTINIKSS